MRYCFRNLFVAALCCTQLTACSVGMALQGQNEPDLKVVKSGATRTDVELQLGAPLKIDQHQDGTCTAVYEYEVGREPSAGRAVAHGAMDVMTLGLWEVIGTPVEVCKGDKLNLIVTYDQNGRIVSATRSK